MNLLRSGVFACDTENGGVEALNSFALHIFLQA